MKLDDWQREVLNYDGDLLLCTGRRVGKTQIMAIKAAEYLVKRPGSEVIVASLTEDQAQLIIIFALNYLEHKYKKLLSKKKQDNTKSKIHLRNNSKIIARPVGNTGDSIRGFNANVLILDEVSRFNEFILTAATPTLLTTGGQIWMCSTPHGKQGYFWECYDEAYNRKAEDARFKVFYKTSEEVINERPLSFSWTQQQRDKALELLAKEKRDKSNLVYGQEYLGLFLDDLQQFFDDELIQRVQKLKRDNPTITQMQGFTYMGCDLARLGGDEITFEVLKGTESPYEPDKIKVYQIESIVKKYRLTTETENDIVNYTAIHKCEKTGIDAGSGSLGAGILDHLRKIPSMFRKIIPMNNRKQYLDRDKEQSVEKEDFYFNLRGMMEKGEIELLDDDEIFQSLKSIQFELVESKRGTRYKIFGSYSHIAEGLVRAAWLAKKEKTKNLNVYWF